MRARDGDIDSIPTIGRLHIYIYIAHIALAVSTEFQIFREQTAEATFFLHNRPRPQNQYFIKIHRTLSRAQRQREPRAPSFHLHHRRYIIIIIKHCLQRRRHISNAIRSIRTITKFHRAWQNRGEKDAHRDAGKTFGRDYVGRSNSLAERERQAGLKERIRPRQEQEKAKKKKKKTSGSERE